MGNPATETVPAAFLGGEADEQFQLFIVESYRDEEFIGYRSLLAPVERLAPEVLEPTQETETTDLATETETTEAALQDETTEEETPTDDEDEADDEGEETTAAETTAEETTTVTADELPEIDLGQWYRVASSEECDGLYRLHLETTEEPETDEGPATPSDEDETATTEDETGTTDVEDETIETETEDEDEDTD